MLDAYTLKKVLPRLVAAVLLVNLSWYICETLIATTNMFGNAINSLLWAPFSSTELKGVNMGYGLSVLLMGSVTIGGSLAVIKAGFIIGWLASGGWFVLLTALLPIVFSVLITFIVLVVRESLLVALVIASPVALVLWVLPGTEQWTKKWWGVFTKLLLMFPAFMLLLTVGEIMGSLAFPNGNGSPIHNIAALGLYIAPYFMLPFLYKFLGGFLGQISGMLNDKDKGLIDRSRNWSKDVHNRSGWKQDQERNKQDKTKRSAMSYRGYRQATEGMGFKDRARFRAGQYRSLATKDGKEAAAEFANTDEQVKQLEFQQYMKRGLEVEEKTAQMKRSAGMLEAQKIAADAAALAAAGGVSTKDAQKAGLDKVADTMQDIADKIAEAVSRGDSRAEAENQDQFNAMASYLASQKADGQLDTMMNNAATTGGAMGAAWSGALRDSNTYGSLKEFSPHLVANMTPGGGVNPSWAVDIDKDLGSAAKLSKEGWKRYIAVRGEAAADTLEAEIRANSATESIYKGNRHP